MCRYFVIETQFYVAWIQVATVGEICEEITDEIRCSNVFDPVCGMTKASDGVELITTYQNICHLTKTKCEINFMYGLYLCIDLSLKTLCWKYMHYLALTSVLYAYRYTRIEDINPK